MSLTIPNTFTTNTPIVAADVNANFSAISAKFSGGIVDADISGTASIGVDKLAARYEHIYAQFHFAAAATAAVPAAFFPVYKDGKGAWTVEQIQWVCNDVGGGTTTMKIDWGYYTTNAPPVWTVTTAVLTASALASGSGYAQAAGQGIITPTVSTIDWPADSFVRCLAVTFPVWDATMIDGTSAPTNANKSLDIVIALRRSITAS